MTDTQVKYQTLMENQRHNYEMEQLGKAELAVKEVESKAKANLANRQAASVRMDTIWRPWREMREGWSMGMESFRNHAGAFKDITSGIGNIMKMIG